MTKIKRVFIDTAPVIYHTQKDKNFFDQSKRIFDYLKDAQKCKFIFSDITLAEACVYPFKENNSDWIKNLAEFVEEFAVEYIHTSTEIAIKSALIRAKFKSFHPFDSIQLATAVIGNCDLFFTNNKRLKKFDEINCVTLDDFVFED